MGFFKWFKKKNDDLPVENNQVQNVENSVEEEVSVKEDSVFVNNEDEFVDAVVSDVDDKKEEEKVDLTEDVTENVVEKAENIEKDKDIVEISIENSQSAIESATKKIENQDDIAEVLNEDEKTTDGQIDEFAENVEETSFVDKTEEIKIDDAKQVIGQDESIPVKNEKPKGFFAKIKAGLSKTRNNIISSVENVLSSFTKIDEDLYEELEEALIMADIGVDTSLYIIEKLREKVKDEKIHDPAEVKGAIIRVITEILEKDDEPFELSHPSVVLIIGVNGVGKTTTIGKLTHNYMENGKTVLLAAADTFRAAAIDQLQVWADRNNAQLIKHQENSDPGAVVYDAVQAAKARNTDILICDTAGRLHNKKNLMEELRKIAKIVNKEYPDAKVETLLVLDATTGQNALQQAKLFKEVADITGLVLTKLDGTAKGGIVLAIKHEMNIPVRYIGVGEQIDDLQEFNSKDFAKALFGEE